MQTDMSNPGTPPMPRPEALKKLAQLRIERLKKEEEEEQWISGEELYTEGSSDEDDMALRTKRKFNEKGWKKPVKSAGNKTKKQIRDEKLRSQSHLVPPQVSLTTCSEKDEVEEKTGNVDSGKDEKGVDKVCPEQDPQGLSGETFASTSTSQDDEIPAEISWRPKRGLKSKKCRTLDDPDKAYKVVIERVKKLKKLLMNESSNFSNLTGDKVNYHSREKNMGIKAKNEANLYTFLTSDWNFLQEKCDVESALTNMNILDLLIEIIDCKQKEAHKKTLDVQRQIRDELSQFILSLEPTDEVTKNINSFLQLCVIAENKDDLKGETDAVKLTMINKSFNPENEENDCLIDDPLNKKIDTPENREDTEQIFAFTEEEQQRLNLLLNENTESQLGELDSNSKSVDECLERSEDIETYAFNQETKQTLEEINEKLQVLAKSQDKNDICWHPTTKCDIVEDKN